METDGSVGHIGWLSPSIFSGSEWHIGMLSEAVIFTMNVCNACSDFWGYCADISIKDAWGKWSADPEGTSMIIVRNPELDDIINATTDCVINREEYITIRDSQLDTVLFKQGNCVKKANCKKAADFNNITTRHKINHYMRKKTIKEFLNDKNKDLLLIAQVGNMLRRIYNRVVKFV